MKKEKMIAVLFCAIFMSLLSVNVMAEKEAKDEKKTKIKLLAEVNGGEFKWDTVFKDVNPDFDANKFLKKRFPNIDPEDYKYMSTRVSSETESLHTFIDDHRKSFKFKTISNHCDDEGIMKLIISGDDSLKNCFRFDDEFVNRIDITKDIEVITDKLGDLHNEIHTNLDDELEKVLELKVLKNIDENMKHVEYLLKSDEADLKHMKFHKHRDFSIGFVLDDELKKEDVKFIEKNGLKLSKSKLDIDHIYVYSGRDDVFNLKFSLDTEGKTDIRILSDEGKELFSDNVVYFPGTYDKETKINLEDKGDYYIYIEQNGKTFASKMTLD